MANTKSAAKRARQAKRRQVRNQMVKSKTKSALKRAMSHLQEGNADLLKETYQQAVKTLSQAASAGVLPKRRAARKISRLTTKVKASLPQALTGAKKAKKAAAPKSASAE